MYATQASVLETLRAVQAFLDEKKADVAPVNDSGARKSLDDLVAQLTAQAVDQKAGRANGRGETARQTRLREDLRLGHMKPIAAIAKAHLRDVPEMHAFSLPASNIATTRIVALAGAMAEAADRHKDVLIAGGLPENFITQLNEASAALTASLTGRTQSFGRSAGATARLSQLSSQARATLRILDALVVPKLRLNDGLLREWRAVKMIQKKRGPVQGSAAAAAPAQGAVLAEKPAA